MPGVLDDAAFFVACQDLSASAIPEFGWLADRRFTGEKSTTVLSALEAQNVLSNDIGASVLTTFDLLLFCSTAWRRTESSLPVGSGPRIRSRVLTSTLVVSVVLASRSCHGETSFGALRPGSPQLQVLPRDTFFAPSRLNRLDFVICALGEGPSRAYAPRRACRLLRFRC